MEAVRMRIRLLPLRNSTTLLPDPQYCKQRPQTLPTLSRTVRDRSGRWQDWVLDRRQGAGAVARKVPLRL